MSPLLHFVEHPLQLGCKVFMLSIYAYRLIHLFSYMAGGERQAPTGPPGTTRAKGVVYSWANIVMPWAMESTRKKPFYYIQFVIFHLGMVAVIGLTFIIPYGPGLLNSVGLVWVLQVMMAAACAVGLYRLYYRISSKHMRAISTPDDYFSLSLLIVLFLVGVLAAPNNIVQGEGALLTFFFMTAFFLVYVPFSKIMHYLYYPFTRYYFGKTMGYRGIYPVRRGYK
ncbi:MAG: hypothetical protein E3J72_00105 [Planctomycetota bacterium]|nr:MAG: hypothetical protein E3J72_00105 [Planctomycetota bacterium]